MATRTDFLVKNVAKQNKIPDIDVNLPGWAVACGLQNHTGPEPTCTPPAGNLGNEGYPPVDFIGTGRIRATGSTGKIEKQPDNFAGNLRSTNARAKTKIKILFFIIPSFLGFEFGENAIGE